ncbi:glycoside hydrolase N-terminal domain-containing protein [Arcticibacter sp. MXS-1]|uniref:glycoside hydrolase family 95 protein n=1 Tax=Arcticibacter sp. MXS-1 TaxID=3341726 RepID=UPI0035A9AAA1
MQLNNARYRAERSWLQKIALVLAWSIVPLSSFAQSVPGKLCLWFNRPAADWNEALPVGNGSLGAMVFGGVSSERLQLNESSVWTGKPADFVNPEARKALPEVRKLLFEGRYAEAQRLAQEKMMGDKKVPSSYQTLGDLSMEFSLPGGEVTEYRRELDLEAAISSVSFTAGGVQFKREVFSSFPAKALVVRLTASKAGALSFALQLSRPGGKATVQVQDDKFLMTEHVGNGTGVRLAARINVLNEGGLFSQQGRL